VRNAGLLGMECNWSRNFWNSVALCRLSMSSSSLVGVVSRGSEGRGVCLRFARDDDSTDEVRMAIDGDRPT